MAKYAATNLADVSTLDVDQYERAAIAEFPTKTVWLQAISPDCIHNIPIGANTKILSSITGIDAETSARTQGDKLTDTVLTHGTVDLKWSDYGTKTYGIDDSAQTGGAVDLIGAALRLGLDKLGAQFDTCAASVAQACSTATYFERVNARAALTDIVAGDILTAAHVRKAHAKLEKQGAPKFVVNGQQCYMAMVHPDVAYDLMSEASGLNLSGPANVNSSEFRLNLLGVSGGFAWFSSSVGPMLEANAGNGGVVDVYNTVFLGASSLVLGRGTFPSKPGVALDLAVDDYSSQIVRITTPATDAALGTFVTPLSRIGFARQHEGGIYRIESSSSIGANT